MFLTFTSCMQKYPFSSSVPSATQHSSLPIASAKREFLSWAMTMWWRCGYVLVPMRDWENEKSKSNSVLLCFSLFYIFQENLNLLNPPYVSLTHTLLLSKYGFDKEISQHDFPSAKYLPRGKIMEKLKHFLCATNNIRLQLILCWNWKEMKYPFIHLSRTLVVVWGMAVLSLSAHLPHIVIRQRNNENRRCRWYII